MIVHTFTSGYIEASPDSGNFPHVQTACIKCGAKCFGGTNNRGLNF